MTKDTIFTPKKQDTFEWNGVSIIRVDIGDNQGYVAVGSIAEVFSIDPRTFLWRVEHSQFFEPYIIWALIKGKQTRPQLCLMAAAMPLFVARGDLENCKTAEGRERLKLFLEDSMAVLAEHFGISERQELQLLLEINRQQVTEQRLIDEGTDPKKIQAELAKLRQEHDEKVQQIREAFAGLRKLVVDYNKAAGEECITEEQQGEVHIAVKTLGQLLEREGTQDPYPGIYWNITRISGRASYKQIPKSKYKDIMEHLNNRIQAHTRTDSDDDLMV